MTVSEVADRLISLTGLSSISRLLVAQAIASRYQELAGRARCRHLRRVQDILAPATLTEGLISTVAGSRAVTADADALAAWAPLGSLEGRYFQTGTGAWFEVEESTSTGLVLKVPFDATYTDVGYRLVARYVELPADCRWINRLYMPRHLREVRGVPEAELLEKRRVYRDGGPHWYSASVPASGAGRRRIELYPYSTQDELLQLHYWAEPPVLGLNDPLPVGVEELALREGAMIDVLRWQYQQAAGAGQTDQAAFYRNEMHAQRTKWEALDLRRALDVDSTGRDKTLGLRLGQREQLDNRDPVTTAWDDILVRWPG